MHFEINVAKDGKHLFATHERSLREEDKAQMVYLLFKMRFPETEGYSVTMTRHEMNITRVK